MSDLGDPNLTALEDVRARALAAISAERDLHDVLTELVLAIEGQSTAGMIASVLLMDVSGKRLLHGAAPSLPKAYSDAIDGVEIGPAVGSCGTAAFYGEPVFVSDIRQDPIWVEFAALADAHGLRACWSSPIRDADGKVLGTFANYYREPRHPRSQDFIAINYLADTVAKAIVRQRALSDA